MEHIPTILIVDDEAVGRETLESLLYGRGYRLVFATNGQEALEQAAALSPDLMLLDVMMPMMDGIEVCRRIRGDPTLAELPIIMVTALDDRESRLEGIAEGADDFISKPFDRAELRMRVHTIIRLNRYRRLVYERARFERLFEYSPDGILLVDNNGVICLANPAIATMMHVEDGGALVDLPFLGFIIPDQQPTYAAWFQTILDKDVLAKSEPVSSIELSLQRPNGEAIPTEVHAAPVLHEAPSVIQIIIRDITRRKQAEAEHIQLLEKLSDRERQLQDLVEKLFVAQEEERRRMAYELHDGLAQIATSAYQHLQTFANNYTPPDQQAVYQLDKIVELAHRVVRETRHAIAGMRPIALDDFGLASAIRMEIEAMRTEGWTVQYEEVTQADRLPQAIETGFFRIFQEAFTNIRKHANTRKVRVSLRWDEQTVRMEVQDWGDGFAQQSPPAGAAGEHIGLIGMHERVTLLGGTFRVESQPGKGTHITAEVPLPETEDTYEPYQERNTSISEATEKTRIILADDHELSRAGVRSMIIGEHWLELVGEATNGNEALDLCQRLRPDLALIDIRMPEMDGLQTTRAMKRVSPTTKVIIVTIHEHPDYLSAAIRAGAAGYLLKDTSRRELLRAIRHVLRGESFLNTELTQRLLQTMSGEQHAAQPTPHDTLTPREKDVLRLLTQGLTNRQIAAKLVISPLTVKVHVKHIIEKFQVSDRTQAAVRAVELGIV